MPAPRWCRSRRRADCVRPCIRRCTDVHQAVHGRALRDYPDRSQLQLRQVIAAWHGVKPEAVLPGNGAAELFTWAARDAAAAGVSALPQPGFADYARALHCWDAAIVPVSLPLVWPDSIDPHPFPIGSESLERASVVWITNPHNPTGQLWSRDSLQPLLARHALVICDEAFLPLLPQGEFQSLIPLVAQHPNLVVIRSLTKLFAIAGLRLGYAIAAPERLQRWTAWRDPWPVNGLALAAPLAGSRAALGAARRGLDAGPAPQAAGPGPSPLPRQLSAGGGRTFFAGVTRTGGPAWCAAA